MTTTSIDVCERTPRRPATVLAMHLLDTGVPLSLLMDLAAVDGPDSSSILRREGPEGLLG